MAINFNKTLLTLGLILSFFPFISPYPIGSDLQPVFFLVAVVCLVSKRSYLQIGFSPILIAVLPLTLFYFRSLENWSLIEFGRMAACLVAYLFFFNFHKALTQRFIFYVSLVWLCVLLFNTFYVDLFVLLFENFLYGMRNQEIGYRGATGLAPEPGFSGLIAVGLLSVSAFKKEFYGEKNYFWPILVFSIASVALTRSGTGSLYLVVFLTLYFLKLRLFPYLVLMLTVFFFAIQMLELGRGGLSVLNLLLDPMSTIARDTSIGTRVLNTIIGFVAVVEYPLGVGFDEYRKTASFLASSYNLKSFVSGDIGTSSNFGRYSVHLGLGWWAFLICIFFLPFFVIGLRIVAFICIAFIFLSTSVSVSFPITWALIALIHTVAIEYLKGGRRADDPCCKRD